jgi:integrase
MSRSLARRPASPLGQLAPEVQRARAFSDAATADATRRAYAADWRMFVTWCENRGAKADHAEPAAVAVYLAWMADHGYIRTTVERAYAGIAHRLRELHPSRWPPRTRPPVIAKVIRGIRRKLAHEPKAKKPITDREIDLLLEACGDGLRGTRNRALLLVGLFGALRRSELVALDVRDVVFVDDGLELTVRRSKTDQEGQGMKRGIVRSARRHCPVRALRAWLDAAKAERGPIFRPISRSGIVSAGRLGDRMVARIIQQLARAIGLDGSEYGGHSLRAGFVTTAARKGKGLDAIMRHTGHRSVATVLRYIRHATLFEENATEGLL